VSVLLLGQMMLIFVGSMHPVLTLLVLVCSIINAVYIGTQVVKNPTVKCATWIVIMLSLQNFMLGTGAHLAGNTSGSLKYMTQVPFITIAFIWLIIFLNYSFTKNRFGKSVRIQSRFFYLLLICIAFSFVIGHGNIQAVLMNIRNLTVFFFVYIIGAWCCRSEKDLKNLKQSMVILAFVLLVAGIILYKGGFNLYQKIGYNEVYIAKGWPGGGTQLDDRFKTTLISREISRMGSLMYEPINLGYFYAAVFLSYINDKRNINKLIAILISGIGLLLTFGKGAWLIAFVALVCCIFQNIAGAPNKRISKLILATMLFGAAGFAVYYYLNIGAATVPHFLSIQKTFITVLHKPIGYGLGTGGNMAWIFNGGEGKEWLASGEESALMAFMFQLGIFGAAVFITSVCSTAVYSKKKEFQVYKFLPFLLVGISLLQENTFTPQCITLFMLFQGAVRRIEYDNKRSREQNVITVRQDF